jgi:aminopeptidase N
MQTVLRLTTHFQPTHYDLSLVLERSQRTFSGTITIKGIVVNDRIALHSKDLTIASVTVDGSNAKFIQEENDQLIITQDNLKPGKHITVISFSGTITDSMHGIYPCYYDHEGVTKELLATQFESHHAREVFPCVDEPDAKATYDVTLTTELGISVLGNMPIDWQREEDGKLVTAFTRSPRMSSYLVAWVAGELHKKSATTQSGVEVNIWATPAQSPESLDFALETATRTIDFFDEYFDTPYPLPKSDHVALPDFSSGAMENWGLITYREVALLADPKTTGISTRQYVATVIAHELSHQWFGNLVTMKWWNNLWLNESFANLMEYIAVDALYPEWNIWLDFSSQESIMALRRDAIDGVQPVQTDVHHPDEISTLFDSAIVYAKGSRLLRMLQNYIGEDAFETGLKEYFQMYAYKNTEADNLWSAFATASGKDISNFMNTWISQPGYPVVHVLSDQLSQEQFFIGPHQSSAKLWPIPLNSSSNEDLPALFETKTLQLPVSLDERLNVGDSAHFLTHYTPDHLSRLAIQVQDGTLAPLDRLQILHEQTMLARGGISSTAGLIPLLESYQNETTDSVWDIIALTLGELKKFVDSDEAAEKQLRALSGKLAKREYERLGWERKPNEPDTDTKLRSTILGIMAYSEDADVISNAQKIYESHSLEELDPELRALIISINVRHSEKSGLVTTLLQYYKATSSGDIQNDISSGVTSTKDPVVIDYLLSQLTDKAVIRPQDTFRWFAYMIRSKESRAKTWAWMRDNWTWINQTFSGDKSFDYFPRYAASGLKTSIELKEFIAFFEPLKSDVSLSRVISMGISEIEGRVELIEKDGPAVRAALLQLK